MHWQVDAEKRTLIKALPPTLVFHLKRFEWDYETYQRWKVGGNPQSSVSRCILFLTVLAVWQSMRLVHDY